MFGERRERCTTESCWCEYCAVGILQCIRKWESCRGGRNHEERRICEEFERKPQAVSSKTGSGLLLCLPTQQQPKSYAVPDEQLPTEGQSEH